MLAIINNDDAFCNVVSQLFYEGKIKLKLIFIKISNKIKKVTNEIIQKLSL